MTLLLIEGFEGFTTAGDRTALDTSFDFGETTTSGEAGLMAGRTGGKAAFIANENQVESPIRVPCAGLSSQDDWVVGFAFQTEYGYFRAISGTRPVLVQFLDSDSDAMLTIYPVAGTIKVRSGGTGGTSLGFADVSLSTYVWYYFECKVKFHASTGSVTIRINEQEVLNLTNVNTVGSSADTRPCTIAIGPAGGDVRADVDDLYFVDDQGSANNDFLGDVAAIRLRPTAAGNSTQFTVSGVASNWDAVNDDDPDSDTTYVQSKTAAQKDTYTFEDIATTPVTIAGVAVKSVVKKNDAGSRTFVHVARSSSTETDSAVIYPSAVTYTHLASIYEQDPNTAAAWAKAGVNSAEFGFKVNA